MVLVRLQAHQAHQAIVISLSYDKYGSNVSNAVERHIEDFNMQRA